MEFVPDVIMMEIGALVGIAVGWLSGFITVMVIDKIRNKRK